MRLEPFTIEIQISMGISAKVGIKSLALILSKCHHQRVVAKIQEQIVIAEEIMGDTQSRVFFSLFCQSFSSSSVQMSECNHRYCT